MTEEDPGVLPSATTELGTTDRARDQVAAVHRLLNTERQKAEHDIVLATVFDYLASGPKHRDEIAEHVRQVWPGVTLPLALLDASLEAAERGGYVTRPAQLTQTTYWELSDQGRLGHDQSRTFSDEVVARCAAYLHDEARAQLGPVTGAEAELWTQILIDALYVGIRKSILDDPAAITVVGQKTVYPTAYDLGLMRTEVADRVADERTRDFLQVMVVVALDPSTPFGAELVHYVVTGYLLYLFVIRHDLAASGQTAGSIRGEVALLDTNILLRFLAAPQLASVMYDAIRTAKDTGVQVRVLAETMAQLDAVIEAHVNDAREVERSIARGADRVLIAETIDDQIISMWLEHPGTGTQAHLPWDDFTNKSATLGTTLKAMGVLVEEDPLDFDLEAAAQHASFVTCLRQCLADADRGRGEPQIKHDATLLVACAAHRAENPASDTKVWPGAVVVTTDTYLADTYARATGNHTFPASVPPGAWISILANCADPAEAEDMAEALSRELSYETLLNRASRVPVELSVRIALGMAGPEPVRMSTVGGVQMSLDVLIRTQPDLSTAGNADIERYAGEVVTSYQARQSATYGQHLAATTAEAQRAETARAADDARNKALREAAERRADQAETDKENQATQTAAEKARGDRLLRTAIATLVVTLVAAVLGALALLGTVTGWGLVLGIALLFVCAGVALDYVVNARSGTNLVIAALVGGGGNVAALALDKVVGG